MLPPPMTILVTRHSPVEQFVRSFRRIDRVYSSFFREHLHYLPPASTVIGNLPVPVVSFICAAGHHYEHVIIPGASNPDNRTFDSLMRNASLLEFHVAEID